MLSQKNLNDIKTRLDVAKEQEADSPSALYSDAVALLAEVEALTNRAAILEVALQHEIDCVRCGENDCSVCPECPSNNSDKSQVLNKVVSQGKAEERFKTREEIFIFLEYKLKKLLESAQIPPEAAATIPDLNRYMAQFISSLAGVILEGDISTPARSDAPPNNNTT